MALTYDVYDLQTDEMVIQNKDAKEIELSLGIKAKDIPGYVNRGNSYKRRYNIYLNTEEKVEEQWYSKADRRVMDIFDQTMEHLKKHYSKHTLSNIVFVCRGNDDVQ